MVVEEAAKKESTMEPSEWASRPSNQTFQVGQRVEVNPSLDLWRNGGKFGTVVKITTGKSNLWFRVQVDTVGRVLRFHPSNIKAA